MSATQISAKDVAELRARTGAGMMDCRKALTETNGDFDIKAYDEVTFFEFAKTNDIKKATVKGEVYIPGTYNITETTTINDLLKISGGFTKKTLDIFLKHKRKTESVQN